MLMLRCVETFLLRNYAQDLDCSSVDRMLASHSRIGFDPRTE